MGYYISLRYSNFYIERDRKEEALRLFKNNMLAYVDILGRGGSLTAKWFSWTDTAFLLAATTIEEVLDHFGWAPEHDDKENIIDLYFENEKIGQEDLLFKTIAPCVREGSFLDIDGEEGEMWRWYFDGTDMIEQLGTVSYA
jgi:hypothetical protein